MQDGRGPDACWCPARSSQLPEVRRRSKNRRACRQGAVSSRAMSADQVTLTPLPAFKIVQKLPHVAVSLALSGRIPRQADPRTAPPRRWSGSPRRRTMSAATTDPRLCAGGGARHLGRPALVLGKLLMPSDSVVWVRWIVAVLVVLALLVAWVVLADLNRGPATSCAPGTVRVHGACIQE